MTAKHTPGRDGRAMPPKDIAVNAPGHHKFAPAPVEQLNARLTLLQDWMFFYGRRNVTKARDVSKELACLRAAIAKATGESA